MQDQKDQTSLKVTWLSWPTDWMKGSIQGAVLDDEHGREVLAQAVLSCLEPVAESEMAFSSCTDGRRRDSLLDGGMVPVREQLVGADTMAAFVAAEALADTFYGSEAAQMPVGQRIAKVIAFLKEHGLQPAAHIGCGAAGGFLTVLQNATQFADDENYVERLKQLLPGGVFDAEVYHAIVDGYKTRLESGQYEGYRDGLVCEQVEVVTGSHAVERYVDDGQGVHGHLEKAIVYLASTISGQALNPNKLIEAYGQQVFMVNSSRADRIARLFGDQTGDEADYVVARIAIEDFACAGHGTLAIGMQTAIVSA